LKKCELGRKIRGRRSPKRKRGGAKPQGRMVKELQKEEAIEKGIWKWGENPKRARGRSIGEAEKEGGGNQKKP